MTKPNALDLRPTRHQPDDDPHLWLEEVDGPEALAWVEARNAETLARVSDATMAADREAALAILDRKDKIALVTRRGGLLYNVWRDADHPLGLLRRTDEASYRTGSPDWEILIDIDALAAAEGEDWVWSGATLIPKTHDRALVSLSRGGGDAVVIREFDLPSRSFVPDGFVLPEANGSCDWLDRDTLILSSALGEDMATRAGYSRTVRLWVRGTDPLSAPVLFETAPENMGLWGSVEHDGPSERVVFVERTGFFDGHVHLGDRTGPTVKLDVPSDAEVSLRGDHLAVRTRSAWSTGGRTHGPDTVLAIGLTAFLAGDRDFAVLWEPSDRRALQGVFWAGGRLIVDALDDLRPGYSVHEHHQGTWTPRLLPGLPDIGTVSVWPLDSEPSESDGALLAMVQDPLTAPTLLAIPSDLSAPAILRTTPASFDIAGLRVTRHEAVSVDGTRIPYVQVGPQVGPGGETGEAPVHLTAYGGFQISLLPTYQAVFGRLWLEKGGTGVVANIRGGGEFGTRWHQAGRREGKALAHDDFAAVAADLVARGVTRPGRIAAEGGSNGGLLIANMLTRYPERFGALFCTIPLIDMRRYSKLLAGASWIAEYGDPDDPEDWRFLGAISAYHTAEPGRPYPPILIGTTRRDDRVHPGHARKMAEKLRAMGYDPAFYEPAAGGHGFGKDNSEKAAFQALGMAFLRRSIGWEPEPRTTAEA